MDLDDDEMIAMREKRDLNKMITECEESSHAVTFYGSDKQIVEKALRFYKNAQEKIKWFDNTIMTGYYEYNQEKYARDTLKELMRK